MARILCLDDEPAVGLILQDTLERVGHEAVPAHNVPQALQALAVGGIDLIISDYRMPGLSGLEFLGLLRQQGYDTPLIMLTGYASIEHAVAAIKAGAVDYITKPVQPEQLELSVNQALEVVRLRRENERLRREDGRHGGADARHRAPRRRIGNRQGIVRAHDSRTERAP
jgi:two-component system response regulator HydG